MTQQKPSFSSGDMWLKTGMNPPLRLGLIAVVCALGLNPMSAAAETIDLVFEPPQIDDTNICAARAPDEIMLKTWETWDGASLAGMSIEMVRQDILRLVEVDPVRWYDTVESMIALMPTIDPKMDDAKQLVERINLMVAAGKLRELTNQRLVEQLLASDQATSPRIQKALADLLTRGIGIEADKDEGRRLLIAAANGGNADAILELVSMQIAGQDVSGWDVDPEIATMMAFGALVGQLDPQICDRVTRIAREYKSGEIVTQNYQLSERWYRFAADLGDANAAWKVAEYHMRSEEIEKDNDVFLKYLTLAAEGGSAYAEVSLGRVYEIGALVPRDLARAEELYARAAAYGDRGGLIRNTLFLQAQAKTNPAKKDAYYASLITLVDRGQAPPWAFTAAADQVLGRKGRWAGEAEAIAFLQTAADTQDSEAMQRLAMMHMRYAETPKDFYAAIDSLIYAVQNAGKTTSMVDLQRAFICRAPAAPQKEEAEYWRDVEAATASGTANFDEKELLELAASKDPLLIARLQSQALYGRPSSLALYMALIEKGDFSVVQKEFWDDYATRFENVLQARGNLAMKLAKTSAERDIALGFFREAITAGEQGAGIYLAAALLDVARPRAEAKAEALAVLLPLAAEGHGAAMALLVKADPATFPTLDAVFAAYAKVIDDRGDFDALLLAIPRLDDPARAQDYKRRATVATACSFDEVVKFADVLGQANDDESFQTWINISDYLTEGDDWRLTQLADTLVRHGTAADVARAFEFYEVAYQAGNKTAVNRLLAHFSDDDTAAYDPRRAADLYVDLVKLSEPEELPQVLARLEGDDAAIQQAAYTRIDPIALYLTAAEAGQPIAMREYGLLARAAATTPSDVEVATMWLARASEGGDVEAMVEYAKSLAFGVGVPGGASPEQALVWLNKAASLGNTEAAILVKSLDLTGKETQ